MAQSDVLVDPLDAPRRLLRKWRPPERIALWLIIDAHVRTNSYPR